MSGSAMELNGKRALVTGAAGGLGSAIADELAAAGAHVLVHARTTERAEPQVDRIRASGGSAEAVAANLSATEDVLALAALDVDILVNNAGVSLWAPTSDFSLDQLEETWAVNVRAPYLLVAGIAPRMAERGDGSIVSLGSIAGELGMLGGAAYGGSKGALAAMTRSWAAEYGDRGVRANLVSPGPAFTKPEKRERYEAIGAATALRRYAEPSEIATAVAFLASPRASYITGMSWPVDGGRTIM